MLNPKKILEIANKMNKYDFYVAALQDVIRKDRQKRSKNEYTLLYSERPKVKNGQYGIKFTVSAKIKSSL